MLLALSSPAFELATKPPSECRSPTISSRINSAPYSSACFRSAAKRSSPAIPLRSTTAAIAWAAIEHLHEANRCRALFATHYHELTALSAKLPRLFNATVRVKEWHGDVVFLHEVLPGSADRSYGIQVAKLAGLPAPVIARAKSVLAKLEAQARGQTAREPSVLPVIHDESDRPEWVGNCELSCRGTRSSNPFPSSSESRANPYFGKKHCIDECQYFAER